MDIFCIFLFILALYMIVFGYLKKDSSKKMLGFIFLIAGIGICLILFLASAAKPI
ncbi:hypothetical protein KJ673_02320 [Patescibacteria group bacterium]|nr:hypothetical protein [Patescibacteria group bacterium]MCG2687805.1 hypothetical protein [Candidatus Parcubacteria bacterium]